MAKFPLYQWKKAGGGSSSIDTQNFASKIKANTFTETNTFNAATTFGGETTFTGVANLNGGFTVPNTAVANAEKEVTNANDNQLINYKSFYWKRLNTQNSITINANTVSAYEFTTSELRSAKHIQIMLRFAVTNYDYTLVYDLTCNNLNYKNQGETKIIHWGDNTQSTLDTTKFVMVTVAQYGNNKIRINILNASNVTIQTGSIVTYMRILKSNFQR